MTASLGCLVLGWALRDEPVSVRLYASTPSDRSVRGTTQLRSREGWVPAEAPYEVADSKGRSVCRGTSDAHGSFECALPHSVSDLGSIRAGSAGTPMDTGPLVSLAEAPDALAQGDLSVRFLRESLVTGFAEEVHVRTSPSVESKVVCEGALGPDVVTANAAGEAVFRVTPTGDFSCELSRPSDPPIRFSRTVWGSGFYFSSEAETASVKGARRVKSIAPRSHAFISYYDRAGRIGGEVIALEPDSEGLASGESSPPEEATSLSIGSYPSEDGRTLWTLGDTFSAAPPWPELKAFFDTTDAAEKRHASRRRRLSFGIAIFFALAASLQIGFLVALRRSERRTLRRLEVAEGIGALEEKGGLREVVVLLAVAGIFAVLAWALLV